MLSASTTDSKSVTIEYRIGASAGLSSPLTFGIYRSDSSQLNPDAVLLSTWTASPALPWETQIAVDSNGQSASVPGTHQLTIHVPGGLAPDPMKPYVVVVADPGFVASTTEQEASFRTYVIGIVTHGALINPSWKHGPPWQLQTAKILKEQGYDAVIAYNWASQSSTPGKAATQGPRLAREILATASRFPANAPVDLHFIGHSEGAVVNTQAIVALDKVATPQLKAGYIEDTLLDPHAANNSVPAQGSEGSGILESLANDLIRAYQAKANDPPVFIPPGVDSTQVFYQHTSARHDHGTNLGVYNLWAQVPVPNLSGAPVSYFNLTAAGAVHSGKYGVALWYRNFVAPSLGNQAPWIQSLQLEGQINQAVVQPDIGAGALASRRTQAWGPVRTAPGPRIVFTGTAAPESKVRVYIGPAAKSSVITLAGQTTTSSNGIWTLTSRPLLDGYDRAIAMAYRRVRGARPGLAVVPVAPLGRFKVTAVLAHARAPRSRR